MTIPGTYTSKRTGIVYDVQYEELHDFESIRDVPVWAVGAFCFCNDKLVLVYADKRQCWEIPGGGREEGETFEECITREIKEESNMKVLELFPLGLDTYTNRETGEKECIPRYAAKVEPFGDFAGDGAEDGEITEIKLIDPLEYRQYFDWQERGETMINKALNVLNIVNS